MIRLLLILVAACAIAAGVAWIADRQGELLFVIDHYEVRTSAAVAIAALILFALAIGFGVRVIIAILATPGVVGDWSLARRARRGHEALSRGLVAAAAGDPAEARREADKAQKLLGAPPLALLLRAQASQLDGDEAGQSAAYRAMLDHPDTEFLGLRGLFMQAMRRGDTAQATALATRAHVLKPRALWAANALFDLYSAQRNWISARTVLGDLAAARLIESGVMRRRRAVLMAAEALEEEARGRGENALALALDALSLSPGLAAVAVLAASKLAAQGRAWRAQDIVEAAWAQSPHPDLATAYALIKPDEDADARARRMINLAHLNRDHFESRMLEAEQAVALGKWSEARRVLAPLARDFASTRVCAIMAEIEQGQFGDAAASHGWLARAVRAPRDAEWRCGNCSWASPRWFAVCGSCGAFDTLAWSTPGAGMVEKLAAHDEGPSSDLDVPFLREANAQEAAQTGRSVPRPAGLETGGPAKSDFIVLARPPDDPGPDGHDYEPPPRAQKGELR